MVNVRARLQGAAKKAAQDHRINLEAASSFFHALLQLHQDIDRSDAFHIRHIMKVLRHTQDPAVVANEYTYDKLKPGIRQLIDLWEQEPLYIGTEAHDRAKVRLVGDLLNQGKLDEAVERGSLTVANRVRQQAENAIFVDENGENIWVFPEPGLIKMKELHLDGFERMIDPKAQILVEAGGTPQWRLDFENREKENRERNKMKRRSTQRRNERRKKKKEKKLKKREKEKIAEERK
ncbi:MAG: hypothetical protein Q9214_003248 [Letrouitia sp. 1 TL-2023]